MHNIPFNSVLHAVFVDCISSVLFLFYVAAILHGPKMPRLFHLVPLVSKSFHFWVSYITFCNFLKIPSVLKVKGLGLRFFEKNSENAISPRKSLHRITNGTIKGAPREVSSEWSCHYVSIIFNFLGNFCVPPLVTSP
jgi:hypothetical protein